MKALRYMTAALVLSVLTMGTLSAQTSMAAKKQNSGSVPIGFGATFINGETYYLVNIAPEVAFGKLGVGLDVNLRFSTSGKLRAGDYETFGDYLRMIRYVRWAQKGDPFYIRLGQLDYALLGHGFIMYNYRNSSSYDLRKTGMELDVNFEKFGLESMYSDFAGRGVLGLRGYVRPLKFTTVGRIPIIGGLETGITYATDLNRDAGKKYNSTNGTITDDGAMAVYGFDVGLPLLSLSMLRSTLYFDHAKIANYGSGSAAGIDLHVGGMGLLTIAAKYERRFIGDHFLPSYFDAMYERERYVPLDSVRFVSKAMALDAARAVQGYYGELLVSILNTINVVGGYQAPLGVPNAGVLHLELETGNVIPAIVVGGGYDRKNIGPLLKLDENSILYAQIGYKPVPYLLVSTLYQWTWAQKKDAAGNVVGYETQRRIEPKVSLVFSF